MKYGVFDLNGIPTAFYSDAINKDIPTAAVKISENEWRLYLDGRHCRDTNGNCVLKPAPQVDLASEIASRQVILNDALGRYICNIYDLGTQASMQALYSKADTSVEIRSAIESVWGWIKSVIKYYYQCKTEIGALVDAEAVAAYAWDFSQFDATCPAVTLQGIFDQP